MHHPDYAYALDVRWLCRACHRWYEQMEQYVRKHAHFVSDCARIITYDKYDAAQVIEIVYGRYGILRADGKE